MLEDVIKKILVFRDDRDWKQFHNTKDLAVALNIESSELLELFLWKDNEEFDLEKLKEELADIFIYGLLLANKHQLDFYQIIEEKLKKNAEKYPAAKSKGSNKKYKEL
ncbi:nucleotide pyrophosphohydrolase [Sinomicrobium sp. M5D2P9]